jgi:cytidylate kinase
MIPTLKLVEHQIAMAGIRNRLETIDPQPGRYVSPDGIAFGPCLLISRECGSGGSQLAQRAGQQLGWNVFDSKIVDEIAHVANVHQRLVQTVDEHIHSVWERNWREFLLDDMPDKTYLRHLRQVVMTLGHQGNVVLVGRGAQYLLPPQGSLRVRVVAPLVLRVQNLAAAENIPLKAARARVNTIDAERTAFVSRVFKKDADSPLNHDIVINLGDINLETATQIVLAMLQKKLGIECEPQPAAAIHG